VPGGKAVKCPNCNFDYLPDLQSIGGKARAKSLTAKRRSEIARAAGLASGAARKSPKPKT